MAPGTRLPDMCPGTESDAGLPATGSEFQTALALINRKRQSNLTAYSIADAIYHFAIYPLAHSSLNLLKKPRQPIY
jgi:hypothetical protein